MRFKLKPKVGSHIERDEEGKPVTYKGGDIVESKHNLVEMFVGKFVRVPGDPDVGQTGSPNIPMSKSKTG